MICIDTFENELAALLNRFNFDTESATPDYILARYLVACLNAFSLTASARDTWYGFKERGVTCTL